MLFKKEKNEYESLCKSIEKESEFLYVEISKNITENEIRILELKDKIDEINEKLDKLYEKIVYKEKYYSIYIKNKKTGKYEESNYGKFNSNLDAVNKMIEESYRTKLDMQVIERKIPRE